MTDPLAALRERHRPVKWETVNMGRRRERQRCRHDLQAWPCDFDVARAALDAAIAGRDNLGISATTWRAERDAANEDAARLAEALRYEASLHPYPADVPDSVNAALAAHRARVDEPTDA